MFIRRNTQNVSIYGDDRSLMYNYTKFKNSSLYEISVRWVVFGYAKVSIAYSCYIKLLFDRRQLSIHSGNKASVGKFVTSGIDAQLILWDMKVSW